MTIHEPSRDWLDPDQVAAALNVSRRTIDSMLHANPPGIPDELVRRLGADSDPRKRMAIRIHASFVDPAYPRPGTKVVGFRPSPVDPAELARLVADELIARLVLGSEASRRMAS